MEKNHSTTIVPIETWLYHSPKLKLKDIVVDMGLVCEALIYYERIFIAINNYDHFNSVIAWFKIQNSYNDFLEMLNDGTINFLYHSFSTYPIYDPRNDAYSIWNMDDEDSKNTNVFTQRILYNSALDKILRTREKCKLYNAIENSVIELKAEEFGDAIDNARVDAIDLKKSKTLVQSFTDELYEELGYLKKPLIYSKIEKLEDRNLISWNVNFEEFNKITENKLSFHKGVPLAGIAHCNRLIKSASILNSDLYLGNVMSSLVNNKLMEIGSKNSKIKGVIGELNIKTEFPRVADFINNEELDFDNVLKLRKEAKKFRLWLEQEGNRDGDAIIAYQNEIAQKTGIKKFGLAALSLTCVGVSVATGAVVSVVSTDVIGNVAGAVVGKSLDKFIASFDKDWKPIVFGAWATKYVDDQIKVKGGEK